jgi:hypothetical protein
MVATMVIEVSLLIYTLWHDKLNTLSRLVIAILFFLALFQLSEYNVCGGEGINAATWSRIGFAAITMLPAFGTHLIQVISKHRWRFITWLAYATAILWEGVFLLGNKAFSGHVCAGNYVIFQLKNDVGFWYFGYYYAWLFIGIGLSLYLAHKMKNHNVRKALILQATGYLVFLLPTTIANTLKPSTVSGIPSIMCGFAVLYALILVFGILPILSRNKDDHALSQ